MAGILDFLSLLLTASIFVGVIVGVIFVVQQVQAAVNQTKESLEKKGLHITDSGVSFKTDKRFDHEDYVDATQRNLIKAIGAASFSKVDTQGNHTPASVSSPAAAARSISGSSKTFLDEKKGSKFGLRKGFGAK